MRSASGASQPLVRAGESPISGDPKPDRSPEFRPGDLVRARGREWVVLPEARDDVLRLRPLGGAEDDATLIYLPLEPERPVPATFDPPDPDAPGSLTSALLLRDALRLKLRAGAGPFRSFGNLNVEPRAYQLAPLLMALKLDPIRPARPSRASCASTGGCTARATPPRTSDGPFRLDRSRTRTPRRAPDRGRERDFGPSRQGAGA